MQGDSAEQLEKAFRAACADDGDADGSALGRLAGQVLTARQQARDRIPGLFEELENPSGDAGEALAALLRRFDLLEEEERCLAALLLLWHLSDPAATPRGPGARAGALAVFDALEARIPAGSGTVDWPCFIDPFLFAHCLLLLLDAFPELPLGRLLTFAGRSSKPQEFLFVLLGEAVPLPLPARIGAIRVALGLLPALNGFYRPDMLGRLVRSVGQVEEREAQRALLDAVGEDVRQLGDREDRVRLLGEISCLLVRLGEGEARRASLTACGNAPRTPETNRTGRPWPWRWKN